MARLASEPDLLALMSHNASAGTRDRFTVESEVDAFVDVLAAAAAQRRGRPHAAHHERVQAVRAREGPLSRAHVPRSASDRLAGPLVGDGFRLRGEEAAFVVDGVRLAAPRRFISNYIQASYEPELVAWLHHNLVPGCVVIDAGAHVGYLSIVMAKLVGDSGHVFAIEPALENAEYLSRNVRANCVLNVDILPVALAEPTRD